MPRPSFARAAVPLLLMSLVAPLAAQTTTAAPATPLRAQDVAVLATSCANCHGPGGQSTGGIPQLRGLPEGYLLQRLQAFKTGNVPDATVMTRLAKGYDDEQLKALAQWFSKKD